MRAIALTNYSIRINRYRHRQALRLDNYFDGRDFLDDFNEYLHTRRAYLVNYPGEQKLLRVTRCQDNGRTISGLIEVGSYGFQTDILKAQNARLSEVKPTYVKPMEEAVMRPFYFCLHIPHRQDLGVLALQRIGPLGIKEIVQKDLQNFIFSQELELSVALRQLVPEQLINHFLKHGRLTKIRLVDFKVPSDLADRFNVGTQQENANIELQLTAKKGGELPYFDRVREVIKKKREVGKFIEVQGVEYENVKVEVTIGERRRTFNLQDFDQIRGNFDITAEVDYGNTGHPTFASIDAVGREFVSEAVKTIEGLNGYA